MTPLQAALNWLKRGFSPVPVPHRSKRPILEGWQRLALTADTAPQYFSDQAQNIGVLLGDQYGSTDVDCDCPKAIWAARGLLPETGLIFGRESKPYSHYLYRSDPPLQTQQFHDPLDHATLIESSEVEQGQRLSLSRVKYLTGLGQIKARRLRENMITLQPTYKLFLDCNHKPVITDPNDAIWNRVKCIPFKVTIPDGEIDEDLPAKLRTELPGILRWMVDGAVLYHRERLGDPPDVVDATEQYRQESDRLKEFFEDRCVLASTGDAASWKNEGCWVPVSELYAAYASWAEATGNKFPLSKDSFDERLQKLGRRRDRVRPDGGRDTKQIRAWLGIRFRLPEDE